MTGRNALPDNRRRDALGRKATAVLIMLVALGAPVTVHAATIWSGPPITFTKASDTDPTLAANQDRITPNVWITRDSTRGIYNARSEEFYSDPSPPGTHWAYGTTADLQNLEFKTWVEWHAGNPPRSIGRNAVLHLVAEDIYVDIRFNTWQQEMGGGFSYTRSTPGDSGPTTAAAIEYYHQEFDHYFFTKNADEIAKLDNGTFTGWRRTGLSFNVYATATMGAASVCRFFSTAFAPKSSHFYTPFADECAQVKTNPSWQFEGDGNEVFYIPVASADGMCGAGIAVYRLYNNGMGAAPNHRYTTSATARDAMVAAGWVIEGNGPGFAFMCAPA